MCDISCIYINEYMILIYDLNGLWMSWQSIHMRRWLSWRREKLQTENNHLIISCGNLWTSEWWMCLSLKKRGPRTSGSSAGSLDARLPAVQEGDGCQSRTRLDSNLAALTPTLSLFVLSANGVLVRCCSEKSSHELLKQQSSRRLFKRRVVGNRKAGSSQWTQR